MQETSQPDYVFKIILVGNSSTGKSSILQYYLKKQAKQNITQTVGVEFASKLIQHQGKSIKLQIWDTAGQERFRSIARAYYRGVIGAIVVYDITNDQSFQSLEEWIADARENSKDDLDVLVIGNKLDLKDNRLNTYQEAEKFTKSMKGLYVETSAKTGENIEQAFQNLIEHIFNRIQNGQLQQDEYKQQLLNPLTKKQAETKLPSQEGGCTYC